jgi:hypothetical protein
MFAIDVFLDQDEANSRSRDGWTPQSENTTVLESASTGCSGVDGVGMYLFEAAGVLLTRVPKWSSTIDRQIERPIPIPFGLVVKNASKIWSISFGSIPIPQSVTAMSTSRNSYS